MRDASLSSASAPSVPVNTGSVPSRSPSARARSATRSVSGPATLTTNGSGVAARASAASANAFASPCQITLTYPIARSIGSRRATRSARSVSTP
jgi:hypothetical protein